MNEQNQATVPDIRKTAVFKASIQKVWAAVSSAEGIAAWFMPNDFEQKLGHQFTLQTPFGPTPCQVLELDPPTRLSFSWGDNGWKVTFELKEVEGDTEFTLIHSGWGAPDQFIPGGPQETNEVIRNRMNNGWESIVHERLRKVVEA